MPGIVIPHCPCCGQQTTFKGSNRCRQCTEAGRLAPEGNWRIEVETRPPTRFNRDEPI